MKEQIKPSVKELYNSLHAPESLRAKTLAAIGEGKSERKARILELNFKTLSAVAACFLLCFTLLLTGVLGGDDINISVDGNSLTADAVICRSANVTYLPDALPMSAKSADNTLEADALKLDVEPDGKTIVLAEGATLAIKNEQGELCEVSTEVEIDGNSELYVLVEDAKSIKVTFTTKKDEKTLIINENSDGTFSVGIK